MLASDALPIGLVVCRVATAAPVIISACEVVRTKSKDTCLLACLSFVIIRGSCISASTNTTAVFVGSVH